ncbi:MAG: TPM domain-containing protein [Crocinitomicaceae bacterium]
MKSNPISAPIKFVFLCLIFWCNTLSFAQDSIAVETDSIITEDGTITEKITWFESYFEPISSSEAEANFAAINTGGVIDDYKNVPDPRTGKVDYSQVSDPHFMLSESAIDTLDKIMKRVEDETGYQMAVVCLNSIGDNNPNMFGTDLFNHWGIGNAGEDNGFLMLVINDVHRVEFINGRGTEIVLTDLQGEDIRQNEMIPHFRENDYVTGIIRGVQCVADVFNNTSTEYNVPPVSNNTSSNYSYDSGPSYTFTPLAWYEEGLGAVYVMIIFILTGIYLIVLLISFFIKDLHKRYHTLKFFTILIIPILFPIPFLILYFLNRHLMNRWRDTERISEKTGIYMHKLDEQSDDKHLSHGQIKEEQVKSIDYDVWVTDVEGDVLVLAYKKWFSKYRKCPKCSHKTYFKEYDRTISAATYTSSGTGERCYSCKSCGHSKITRYTIPRKQKSSSSSSGGYSSSSSGGSYSSGSSSSWGGGSSGGGGGGSSW